MIIPTVTGSRSLVSSAVVYMIRFFMLEGVQILTALSVVLYHTFVCWMLLLEPSERVVLEERRRSYPILCILISHQSMN